MITKLGWGQPHWVGEFREEALRDAAKESLNWGPRDTKNSEEALLESKN